MLLLSSLIFLADPTAPTAWAPPTHQENASAGFLVEAEAFSAPGGWKLDTQFNESLGSPYLLAHGLGVPVADAVTEVHLPRAGTWRVLARTFDWVERWQPDLDASQAPGRFRVVVDGRELPVEGGTTGASWGWHALGSFDSDGAETAEVRLRDLTGFDGRVDALYFTTGRETPPNGGPELKALRSTAGGHRGEPRAVTPADAESFDLVVVGGGYAGVAAAISAARMGARVALIQDRDVLGGNGSSEVRVWAKGHVRRGRFPRVGEIVEEFCDHATLSPGPAEEFEDNRKMAIVRAEPNITLRLGTRMDGVQMSGGSVRAVEAFDVRTGERLVFPGRLFCDATGHGELGARAGADLEIEPKGRLGMSNMWVFHQTGAPRSFPEVPWALQLGLDDFPIPRDGRGEWFWESGYDMDPIADAEGIRDWNLRAVFGAFGALKRGERASAYRSAELDWVAYVGGPRESRRLMGDVVLSRDDIVEKRDFPDGCVATTWTIDLHYPKPAYDSHPGNPFIAYADHDRRIDRGYGYPVPYRCFYSRNIANLFMAGRDVSVTHEALGTVRVMRTCGMMGEVVGKAAALAVERGTTPRGIYEEHLSALFQLLELPGSARRVSLGGPLEIPANAVPRAGSHGPLTGVDPASLPGLVVDDVVAEKIGTWSHASSLPGHIGWGYAYASPGTGARLRFTLTAESSGTFEVELAYRAHENRGPRVPVRVEHATSEVPLARIDMRKDAGEPGFVSLTTLRLEAGETVTVEVSTEGAGGLATADAARLRAADKSEQR